MKKYIVRPVPSKGYVKTGDWVRIKGTGEIVKVVNTLSTMLDGSQTVIVFENEGETDQYEKVELYLCANDVKEGDDILAIQILNYTDEKIQGFIHGKLTKIWEKDKYPECEIDGKIYDLVSEGHSSRIYRVVCPIDPRSHKWVKNGMEFSETDIKISSEWEWKDSKYLIAGDEVEIKDGLVPGATFAATGVVKSVRLMFEHAWDYDDQMAITNVRKQVGFEDDKGVYEDGEDITLPRKYVSGKKWIEYYCDIKCPTCEHFH